jgi:DNA-binding transcriptional LysR family regulator
VRAILEERLGERYDALDVRLELASDALMRCVEEGMGITFLPERVAEKWVRSEPIATVGIADLDLTRELAFVVAESRARIERPCHVRCTAHRELYKPTGYTPAMDPAFRHRDRMSQEFVK